MRKRKHEERFSAAKYWERKQKAEAYFRFLKNPASMRMQQHFHNIIQFGEKREPVAKAVAR